MKAHEIRCQTYLLCNMAQFVIWLCLPISQKCKNQPQNSVTWLSHH